jgi:hypothetical protein
MASQKHSNNEGAQTEGERQEEQQGCWRSSKARVQGIAASLLVERRSNARSIVSIVGSNGG